MANPYRLICGLLLLVLSVSAYAFPAKYGDRWQAGSTLYESAQAACNAVESRQNTAVQNSSYEWLCAYSLDPLMANATVYKQTTYYCPANATLAGQDCGCNSGYSEKNGVCVATTTPDAKCAGDFNLSGFALGSGKLLDSQVLSGEVPTGDMCWPHDSPSSGCTVRFVQDKVVTMPGGTKQTYGRLGMYQGPPGTTQGKACEVPAATPGDGTTVEEKCSKAGYASSESSPGGRVCLDPPKCPGGFGGEVNGVEVCVKDEGTNVVKSEKNTETKNKDGSTDKVNEKTTCQGNTCTTEKTTTSTPSGGGSSTVINSSTVVQSKEDYCKSNANSAQCNSSANGEKDGKGGSFGGSCEAGFACEGDALQCAIARDQHKRNCQMFDDKTSESQLYGSEVAKGSDRDVTKDLPGNTEVDVAGKLSSEDVLGGGRCIGDLNVQVWRTSVSLPFGNICPSLGYLGWVLVAVCSLAAFRIVSGPSKED